MPLSLHRRSPGTLLRPSDEEIANLRPGNVAKVIFMFPSNSRMGGERMWIQVESRTDDGRFAGRLISHPVLVPDLRFGDHIEFSDFHVIDRRAESDDGSAGDPVQVLSMRHGSYSKH
jgi:hypothetical protein